MAYKVGHKGQIVIEKTIRDKLGIEPGWIAVQLLVDDHVQIHFVPPEHGTSLAGSLADYAKPELNSEEAFRAAREQAWSDASTERWMFDQPDDE